MAVDTTPLELMKEEPFHSIRDHLHAVIAELKRRFISFSTAIFAPLEPRLYQAFPTKTATRLP